MPQYTARGVGTKLLQHLLQYLEENTAISRVALNVREDNPAKRLYHRFQFQVLKCHAQWASIVQEYFRDFLVFSSSILFPSQFLYFALPVSLGRFFWGGRGGGVTISCS